MGILMLLVIITIGVTLGGLFAYRVARWSLESRELQEENTNRVLLRENVHRVKRELRRNIAIVSELSEHPERAATYADTFSFFAFDHLRNSPLYSLLPSALERCIFDSYCELNNFIGDCKRRPDAPNTETIHNILPVREKLESLHKQTEDFRL